MFVKVTNGSPSKYPYALSEMRRENANVSFPEPTSDSTLAAYGVYRVETTIAPKFDNKTHMLANTVENVDGVWKQKWIEVPLEGDQASINVRRHRDRLLAETDWIVVFHSEKGTPVPAEWEVYRQALRDITGQEGFPNAVVWPTKP